MILASPTNLPAVNWLVSHPILAMGVTVITGLIDGINPCAITTLLLFIGGLLAVLERASQRGNIMQTSRYTWFVAGAFIIGNFLLYFALGVGFIEIANMRIFGNTHLFTRISGFIAVIFGLLMIAEYVFPNSTIKIAMPGAMHGLARGWGRKTTVGMAFISGILIGTCTIPCGGAMYLVVASLFSQIPNPVYSYILLTVYNIAFVLPLVMIVMLCNSRLVLTKISRLHIKHRGQVKFMLGCFVIVVGLLSLL